MTTPPLPCDAIEKGLFRVRHGLTTAIFESLLAPRLRKWVVGRAEFISEAEALRILADVASFIPPMSQFPETPDAVP